MFFEWASYDQDWREPTLDALALTPQATGPYRNRMSVTPLLKFALTPQVSVAGGVSVSELDPLDEDFPQPSQMANVAVGSVRYRQTVGAHAVGAAVTVRAGTATLESDFDYDRYLGQIDYSFRRGGHRLFVSGMAGRIRGTAPLFERFALGDAQTLRGWDKYDLSPLGGDRMVHTSVEYGTRQVAWFLDAGSVWDAGADRRVRVSTGLGLVSGPFFATLGFPLNTDEFRAVFSIGFRSGLSVGVKKH
jgi:outer membrane translocation and assembly module TamA